MVLPDRIFPKWGLEDLLLLFMIIIEKKLLLRQNLNYSHLFTINGLINDCFDF